MKELWRTAFLEPLQDFLVQFWSFLPHFLAMGLILTLGILAASGLKFLICRLLQAIKFDQICGRTGLTSMLMKGGIRESPTHLSGRMVYWAIILVSLMLGLSALNLKPVDQFVNQVFAYFPNVVVAFVILTVGVLLGNFFSRATLIAAVNAQITQARLLARAVRLAILLFSLAMAFEQLGIAKSIIVAAFSISFGGVVMAMAIAFGLGSKDAVKDFIEKKIRKETPEKENDFSHL